jgi:hypothetical protein
MSLASDYTSGQGGLKFIATAPPGQGRLIRIPFYLESATVGFDAMVPGTALAATMNANGIASTSSPAILAAPAAAAGFGTQAGVLFLTPQISWATLRIVGFEVCESGRETQGIDGKVTLNFKNLQIGGGANLFVHEDYGTADIYAAHNDSFAGLRDYPLLKSPNVAQVEVRTQTNTSGGASPVADSNVGMGMVSLFTCNLVCEILQDDNYGSHVPGPYARKGAMVRRGGSFV